MSLQRRSGSNHGFTIVELTIVIALFGILVVGLFGGYTMVKKLLLQQNTASLKGNLVMQTIKTLSNDLNNMYYAGKWDPEQIFRVDKEIQLGSRVDRMNFPSASLYTNPATMQSNVRSITYFAAPDEDTQELTLYRKEDIFLDKKNPTSGLAVPIFPGIQSLIIEFSLNGSSWFDEWDHATKKAFPRHIKVTIKWQENDNDREFSFSVNPPLLWN